MLLKSLLSSFPFTDIRKGLRFIFVFHDVSPLQSFQHYPVYSTTPDVFQNQLKWLRDHFQLLSLDDLVQTNSNAKNFAAVVFDDGFKSFQRHALPILKENNVPFTVFLNQNAVIENWLWCSNVFMAHKHSDEIFLGKIYDHHPFTHLSYEEFKKSPAEWLISEKKLGNDYSIFYKEEYSSREFYMNKGDIEMILNEGACIGSHTMNHKVLSMCDDKTVVEEIAGNNAFIVGLTGMKTPHFALPFGFAATYDERSVGEAKNYHSYIYSTERMYFQYGKKGVLPRIGVRNETPQELTYAVNVPSALFLRDKIFG